MTMFLHFNSTQKYFCWETKRSFYIGTLLSRNYDLLLMHNTKVKAKLREVLAGANPGASLYTTVKCKLSPMKVKESYKNSKGIRFLPVV